MQLSTRLLNALDEAADGLNVSYRKASMEKLLAMGLVRREGAEWVATEKGWAIVEPRRNEEWRKKVETWIGA